jgi:hypothetical protein
MRGCTIAVDRLTQVSAPGVAVHAHIETGFKQAPETSSVFAERSFPERLFASLDTLATDLDCLIQIFCRLLRQQDIRVSAERR